jgi:hypothetical protein
VTGQEADCATYVHDSGQALYSLLRRCSSYSCTIALA